MFRTDQRLSIVEALAPPDGYRVDALLATTYSLDVSALVAVLSAVSGQASESENADWSASEVAGGLLGLKSRVVVFAQQGLVRAGRVGRATRLLNLFDRIVVPVSPKASAFHPKVWLVRFKRIGRGRVPERYRLICSSRNLTTANTWECGVVLDGAPARTAGAIGPEVARFLRAVVRAARHRGRLASSLVRRVATVRFEERGRRQRFTFLGQSPTGPSLWRQLGKQTTAEGLFVAPFVSAGFLEQLKGRLGGRLKVVSVQDELDKIACGANSDLAVWLGVAGNAFTVLPEAPAADLRLDLHAKLLFAREGQSGTTFVGSANGTAAAWGTRAKGSGRNWEAAVAILGPDLLTDFERYFMYQDARRRKLRPWVQPYQPQRRRAQQLVEDELEDAQRRFGAVELEIRWQQRSALVLRSAKRVTAWPYDRRLFRAHLAPLGLEDPQGAFLDAAPLLSGRQLVFRHADQSTLGAFVLVRLESVKRPALTREFLLMAHVIGPDGWRDRRDQTVLRDMLGDRQLLSLIVGLLKGGAAGPSSAVGKGSSSRRPGRRAHLTDAVLEPLLRLWATDREQFDFFRESLAGLHEPRGEPIADLLELVHHLRAADLTSAKRSAAP